MNVPGRAEGNWSWRCTEDMLSAPTFHWLQDLTKTSNRLLEGHQSIPSTLEITR